LGELHTGILSTVESVKQIEEEVARLKQENELLRKELNLAAGETAVGETGVLRLTADSTGSSKNEDVFEPLEPAPAPGLIETPDAPTEPPATMMAFSNDSQMGEEPGSFADPQMGDKSCRLPMARTNDTRHFSTTMGTNKTRESIKKHLNDMKKRKHHYEPKGKQKTSLGWVSGSQEMAELNDNASHFHSSEKPPVRGNRDMAVRTMLLDPETMKQRMKDKLNKPDVHLHDFYYKTGYAQCIARSTPFEHVTLAVIFLNTIWIAIDTEHNDADVLLDAEPQFQVIEHSFCFYFVVELLIRFAAFENKRDSLKSMWFIFDLCLVIPMVFEDWIMTIVLLAKTTGGRGSSGVEVIKNAGILRLMRIMRLARLGRALKLIRCSPEVMVLVKAVAASARSVVWTCVLLSASMFFFGVCFTEMCKDTALQDTHFRSLTSSMHTLLIAGLFPDLMDLSEAINDEHFIYWLVFIGYLALTTITVMNLLIGVLVQVAQSSAIEERDVLDVAFVKEVFVSTLSLSEVEDFSIITISQEEFVELLEEDNILRSLAKVGIDVFGLIDLLDFIFINGPVGLAELMELVLQLRSSADVTVRDLVEVRKFLTYEISKMTAEVSQTLSEQLQKAQKGL